MNQRQLLQAIGQIDDDLIAAYDHPQLEGSERPALDRQTKQKVKQRFRGWRRPAVIAAGICLIAAVGLTGVLHFGFPIGGAQGGGYGGAVLQVPVDAEDPVADAYPSFMFYDGPILPLSLLQPVDGLIADRTVTFDFSPYEDQTTTTVVEIKDGTETRTESHYATKARVTDDYTLHNQTASDLVLTVAYPFASSLHELIENSPTVKINDQLITPDITAGAYSGDFEDAWGADRPADQALDLNLREIDSWPGYQQLLADGQYQSDTFAEKEMFDPAVTVYEVTDARILSGGGANPSLAVSYQKDPQTLVFSYGFHGMRIDSDGHEAQGFSLPQGDWDRQHPHRYCLISVGGSLENMQLQGYQNMGWDAGTEMEISAEISSFPSTLRTISRELMIEFNSQYDSYNSLKDPAAQSDSLLTFDLLYNTGYDFLLTHGGFSGKAVDRYAEGWLSDIFSEAARVDRVLYLTTEVTIPAGGHTDLSVALEQQGGHDFIERKDSIRDVHGYDMATRLGSQLQFSGQTATIADHGQIEIVRQNFGFDLSRNIRTVELAAGRDYYYLLIRKLSNTDE